MCRGVVGAIFLGWSVLTVPGSAQPQDTRSARRLLVLTHNAFYKPDILETLERTVTELRTTGGFDVTSLEGYKQRPAGSLRWPDRPWGADRVLARPCPRAAQP